MGSETTDDAGRRSTLAPGNEQHLNVSVRQHIKYKHYRSLQYPLVQTVWVFVQASSAHRHLRGFEIVAIIHVDTT